MQVETVSAELNLAQPQEIETYDATFKRFAALASYGSSARSIIAGVMSTLSAELEAARPSREGVPNDASPGGTGPRD
ncbi:hypothetical protein [Spongiactinospora rosea]|uniref:hypothetical protein n=1 Tax=Spongiactinospora rosea TaxID=2248750 RepID=UPI0018F470B5|nr:hypothetical protein [Spongiactinospora rosea]